MPTLPDWLDYALVSSRLDYANSIVYGMSKSLTTKLQRQQNILARVVLRTNRLSSAGPLLTVLSELHWLLVASRIQFKIAIPSLTKFLPQANHPICPHYWTTTSLLDSFVRPVQISSYNHTQKQNLALLDFTPLHLWIWNCLPADVRSSPSIQTFKKALKTLFPQPSHLGHVPVLRLRFRFGWAHSRPCPYDLGVCFKSSLLLLLLLARG